MTYSFWQRLKVKLLGRSYLEHRTRPGWTGYLPFYLAKCFKHGYFEDYPHGYHDRLDCSACLKEGA